MSPSVMPTNVMESMNHYTVQRIVDVNANVDGRDLGSVAADIQKVLEQDRSRACPPPPASNIRGQNDVMNTAFSLISAKV